MGTRCGDHESRTTPTPLSHKTLLTSLLQISGSFWFACYFLKQKQLSQVTEETKGPLVIARSTQSPSHQEKLRLGNEVSSHLPTLILTLCICLMDASGVQGTHTPVLPRSEGNSPVQNP